MTVAGAGLQLHVGVTMDRGTKELFAEISALMADLTAAVEHLENTENEPGMERKSLLHKAEKKAEAAQTALDGLRHSHPEKDVDGFQQKISGLNARLMEIEIILDKPDNPIVSF